jgi:hypothetical protein
MLIEAKVPRTGKGVGCFDPLAVLLRMADVFGQDLEYDLVDTSVERYEQAIQTAALLGKQADFPPVISAARVMQEQGPRYQFRLRIGPEAIVNGMVDRYSVQVLCATEDDFPEPMRERFIEFLESLLLGQIRTNVVVDA